VDVATLFRALSSYKIHLSGQHLIFFDKRTAVNVPKHETRILRYLFVLEKQIHRGQFLWYQNKPTGQRMVLTFELLTVSENAERKSTGDLAVHFWVILDDSNLIKSQLLQKKGQILLTIFLKHLTQFTSSYFISPPRC
jgi:hypothetical protein